MVGPLAGDKLQHFGGDRMRNLLQHVEAALRRGKFDRPPIGPIGTVLAFEDDAWAVAVEVGRVDKI